MPNLVETKISGGRTAIAQDLGTYLLSQEIAPLLNRLRKSELKPEIKTMTPEELKAHYGTDKPTDEQLMADMDIDFSAMGELTFKVLPLGIKEPPIILGYLNEGAKEGPVLKWGTTGDVVSVADTKLLMKAIMSAGGIDTERGASFRGSMCHTAQ